MEYTVELVDTDLGETLEDLEQLVNKRLLQGWRPLGGVAVCSYEMDDDRIEFRYFQALVRDAKPSEAAS